MFKEKLRGKILSVKQRYIDEPATERVVKEHAYHEAYKHEAHKLARYHGRKEALAAARAKYSGKKSGGLLGGMFTGGAFSDHAKKRKSIWD